ncbi:MAG: TetR/AcrR family transcriptional regulator [Planctomycetes bacterium]|nr:TetR/AcrR family transcriptional regulator [Planctomycetota bacterium]
MPASPKVRRPVGRPPNAELQERRREEILDAAAEVFAKHGFAVTDVQEIADKIGVGKGTIYRYFPSKEELFLAAVDHGMRQLKETVDAAVGTVEQPLERIGEGVRAYLTFFDEHPGIVELLIHERAHFRDRMRPTYFVHREANMAPWEDLFHELIRAGIVRDLPVEQITGVISDLLYGTMFTNYFAGRKKSLASQCEDALDILFRGLLTESKRGLDE